MVPTIGHADNVAPPDINDPVVFENLIRDYIKQNYVGEITDEKLDTYNLKGLFNGLDAYSSYMTPEEFKSFNEVLNGSFFGIGIHIEEFNKYIRVVSPITDSPAAKAGLEPGDIITKVDGVDVTKRTLQENVNKIKGAEGTTVTLTVVKAKTGKTVTLNLKRAKITVKIVETKVLANQVGYLKLNEFSTNSFQEFYNGLQTLEGSKIKSLVIDLRNNPGGSLDQVLKIADYLCVEGDEIINIDYKSESDVKHIDKDSGYNKPIVVLINKGSASASEILAAALKENKRATIVGETSYGKGSVQSVMGLNNGAGIKLTVAEYFGPKMLKINGVGVEPNVVVSNEALPSVDLFSNLAPFIDKNTYKSGAKNLDVYAAQQRLRLLGQEIPTTAVMDAKTVAALKAIQSKFKVKATGELDNTTKLILEAKTKELYTRITSDLVLEKALEILK